LAWVVGGAIGIALPLNGRLGFGVAAAILAGCIALTIFTRRGGQLPPIRRSRRTPTAGVGGGPAGVGGRPWPAPGQQPPPQQPQSPRRS
jgi:hypothetical protein